MSPVFDMLKITFQLSAHDEHLEVRATSPSGEGKAETTAPSQSILDQLAEFDLTNIPLSVLQSVGKRLYQSLLVGNVAKLVSDVLQDGMQLKQPVQFELRFDADQVSLAQYPWEIITDDLDRFLVREGLVDLTRYITYPQPPPVFDVSFHGLPLLRIVSQPSVLPPIVASDLGVGRIETLRHATFEQFMRKLLIERMAFWGLQFDGHGGLVSQCIECNALNTLHASNCRRCRAPLSRAKQVGALAFERNGGIDWISTAELGSILYNADVRLALLLACETGRIGDRFVFSGLAPGLILAGVPAVIGMQYPVLDDFANSFASSFYMALLEQEDVLGALRTARRVNLRGAWYSPVLYLRHQKTAEEDTPAYHTRHIDTAVPAEAQAGVDFLVRLWIRRPETKPLTPEQLREELDVPESVPISTREAKADVKFEPVEGRKLRRGEVQVQLRSTGCEITPESIKLFVDEHLDAPPAIFTVQARKEGRIALIFSVWQDGGQIHSVTQRILAIGSDKKPTTAIRTESHIVRVEGQERVVGSLLRRVEQGQQVNGSSSRLEELRGRRARVAPTRDAFFELKQRIQDRLIAELDSQMDISETDEVRRTIEEIYDQILAQEGIILSRRERQRLFEQIVAETLGDISAPYIRKEGRRRIRVLTLEPELILIPAGKFLMGSDPEKDKDAFEWERPQHRLYLPDHFIAKTPVTNAQYAAFVEASAHGRPRHWKDGKLPKGKEDHPVVGVSWYDAVAYCNWLAEVTGKAYHLPSEAEWEKGARGTDGRIYPWGNQWDPKRCNSLQGGPKWTTPVGAYPQGASPYGLLDMAGNVWEWTRSLWGKELRQSDFNYPYDPTDGREALVADNNIRRVVRGGSFLNIRKRVRCAFRSGYSLVYHTRYLGFRVCVRPRQD